MQSLYVDQTGTPGSPSIVFLHGIGASGWMWRPQVAALADFDCLNVDLPGHGNSNQVPWLSFADAADHVAALIRADATNGRAHVVGLSLGGHVALALLERHTDLVERAVISGVTAAPMPNRVWLGPQLALMSFLFRQRWFVRMQARALGLSPDMQAAFTDNLFAMSLDAYRRIYTEAVDYRVPPALSAVSTPTLITAGGRETPIILDAVGAIMRLMPNAAGYLAPGHGHGWNVEAPDLFNAMLRTWFTNAPLPGRLQRVD
ncbi:MAG: alpha/beta fold hydrolase [Anaerolineae bacterium]|nr:alpha/beta fold hydrolase [Anaerolineae bacterium]